MQRLTLSLAVLTALTVSIPASAQNSDDWKRLGIEVLNQLNQQNQQQPQYAPSMAPNASGNANSGQYRNKSWGPNSSGNYNQGGFGGAPNTSSNNNNWQFQNPNYFNGSTSNHNHGGYYQNGQYYNQPSNNNTGGYYYNGRYYSNSGQSNYRPQTSTPSYSTPPVAPKRYSNLPIVIDCPSWCEGTCEYQLITGSGKAYDYSITGGKKQRLKENSEWKIRYNQGNGLGYKTYDLRGGQNYELRKEENGSWAFYLAE